MDSQLDLPNRAAAPGLQGDEFSFEEYLKLPEIHQSSKDPSTTAILNFLQEFPQFGKVITSFTDFLKTTHSPAGQREILAATEDPVPSKDIPKAEPLELVELFVSILSHANSPGLTWYLGS
jgi:hypothetical protein